MKKTSFFLILSWFHVIGHAQGFEDLTTPKDSASIESDENPSSEKLASTIQAIKFYYDRNGNVIQRKHEILRLSAKSMMSENSTQDEKRRTLVDERSMSITADRAWSSVCISFLSDLSSLSGWLHVYTLSGTEVYSERITQEVSVMDMSFLPNRVYIFSLLINGNKKTYKLIKNK